MTERVDFEATIGLETHVQLRTATKLFCACRSEFGAPPNTLACPVCAGLPGVLPVLNRAAFETAIRAALALRCRIAEETKFDRKNYLYPDLPKGYQISQYDRPLSSEGWVEIEGGARVRIRRAHLEEDAGKAIHDRGDRTLVDLNRCGVPLLEIVTEPDLRTPPQAHDYLVRLKRTMRYAGVSDCDMEKGSLRCDVNVSLAPPGSPAAGTKVEIKNLNSFRMVVRALEHEIRRQGEALARGERIAQETRLWRDGEGVTLPMRSKEEAHDYRYFPEPDLPPFRVSRDLVERLRATLPEDPVERGKRFEREYALSRDEADLLVSERGIADYYEELVRAGGDPKASSNWVAGEVLRELNEKKIEIEAFPLAPAVLAPLLALVREGRLSVGAARQVFRRMVETGRDPASLAAEMGLEQVSDAGAIEEACRKALSEAPDAVAQFRAGKEKALDALVGRVMRSTKGKANPRLVNDTLRRMVAAAGSS